MWISESEIVAMSLKTFYRFKGNPKHPILFHVIKGRVYLRDFRNGMLLTTDFDNQKLKVTKYSNGVSFIALFFIFSFIPNFDKNKWRSCFLWNIHKWNKQIELALPPSRKYSNTVFQKKNEKHKIRKERFQTVTLEEIISMLWLFK